MAIEYKTVTYRTVESANDNATYCWVELSAAHVPAVNGLIKRITIHGGTTSASGMTTDPMYLAIWERQTDGGLIFLGCSKNTVTQRLNHENVWEFDGTIIRGKSLLLGLLSSPDEHWTNNTQLLLRSTVQTNDTDGCVILTDIGRIRVTPDITFTVDVPEYVPDDEPEPEPDSDDTERVIDISKYWIPLIRDTAEFQQIAAAVNPELNRLLKCKNEVEKSCFLDTVYSLKKWEYIFNLTVTDDMTFEERKSQVLNRLNQNVPYTSRVVRRMIAAMVGEGNFRMSIDNDTQTLHLSLTAGAMSKTADIDQLLARILPMELVVKYDDFPLDYTLLEYLEFSGTQYFVVPQRYNDTTGIRMRQLTGKSSTYNWPFACYLDLDRIYRGNRIDAKGTIFGYFVSSNGARSKTVTIPAREDFYEFFYNFKNDRRAVCNGVAMEGSILVMDAIVDGESMGFGSVWDWYNQKALGFNFIGKYFDIDLSYETEVTMQLVPVLDADGVPCMFDKVSKQCFYNKGKGTFGYRVKTTDSDIMTLDLDDPYYTAPSGVWAKPIDEYTLDIITALDPTVDESQGYKLFANAGEAYQYFNIKEVIENE